MSYPRKVSDRQLEELQTLRSSGWTLEELALRYGISRTQACRLSYGERHDTPGVRPPKRRR